MYELVSQVHAIGKGMWKYRWAGVAFAWLVGIVGSIVVLRIPDQYEASARIYVDTQTILKPLMSGLAVQPDIDQQVTMLSRTLISRPNVEKLVRMADLDLKNQPKAQQDAMIENLMQTLRVASAGRDNLYTLSFRDPNQDKAKRAVQSLVSIFVESSLGASRKDTDTAKVFINEQIKAYQSKLEEAEARVKDFRLKNLELQFGDGKDTASRIGELSQQLEKARLDLREAEQARDAAKAGIASEKQVSTNLTTQSLLQESNLAVSTPEIDGRLEAQKRNLDQLLQRFTDAHPDVVSARRLVKDLEDQKKKEVAEQRKIALASGNTGAGNSAANTLATQELNRMAATSEVTVAALRARVSEYASRYAQAQQMLKTAPQLEAEAAQLNRDYAIHKKNYEDLVARRESAAMSGDLDVASGMADFRLIDPPRVSNTPVSPNRLVILPLVLIASIGAGLFVAFAASQMRPVFFKAVDLRNKLDLPILGVVSMVTSPAVKRRERSDLIRFGTASGGLVVLFLVGLMVTVMTSGR